MKKSLGVANRLVYFSQRTAALSSPADRPTVSKSIPLNPTTAFRQKRILFPAFSLDSLPLCSLRSQRLFRRTGKSAGAIRRCVYADKDIRFDFVI
eukprot:830923-Rhodomonas_salina.4